MPPDVPVLRGPIRGRVRRHRALNETPTESRRVTNRVPYPPPGFRHLHGIATARYRLHPDIEVATLVQA